MPTTATTRPKPTTLTAPVKPKRSSSQRVRDDLSDLAIFRLLGMQSVDKRRKVPPK